MLVVWAVRHTFNTWPFALHLGTGRHSGLGDIHQPLPHASTAASEVGVVVGAALADGSALLPTATTTPSEGLTKKRRDSMRSAASHKAAEPSAPPSSARVVVRGDPCSGTTTAHLLCARLCVSVCQVVPSSDRVSLNASQGLGMGEDERVATPGCLFSPTWSPTGTAILWWHPMHHAPPHPTPTLPTLITAAEAGWGSRSRRVHRQGPSLEGT